METTSNTSEALKKTIYSAAFNSLTYYGAWTIQTSSSVKKKAYAIYQLTMLGIALTLVYSLCSNMLVIFGDIKKMSWNLCVTTLFGGALMKCIFLFRRRQILNSLRVSLHEDFKSRNSSENVVVQNESLKLYKKIRWIFHGSLSAFGTIWIVSRFLNHMLPIPLELPVDFDMEVYLNYVAIFALFTFMAVAGITFAVEQELAMFAIMVQIRREYEIFLSDIPKLNEGLHKECTQKICRRNLIINPWLQQTNTKIWLKELMIRQQTLLK